MKILRENYKLILLLVFTFATALFGTRWGLPSSARTELVLPENLRSREIYELMAKTRSGIYEKVSDNPSAYAGRMSAIKSYDEGVTRITPANADGTLVLAAKNGKIPHEILLAMNAFLLRTNHPHEQDILSAIAKMRPAKFDFNPRFFRYGGSYVYPIAAMYAIAAKVGYLKISPDITFYHARPDEIAKFYIIGRLLSCFAATMCVLLIYMITKNIYDKKTAILAALFSAIVPITLVDANIMRTQPYAAAWALLFIYFVTRIYSSSEKKYFWLAGASIGMSIGASINSFIYFFFLPLAIYLKEDFEVWHKKIADIVKAIALVSSVALAVFLFTNPYLIFSLADYRDELKWVRVFVMKDIRPWLVVTQNLRESMGVFLWAATLAGIIYALVKRNKGDVFLASLLLPALAYVAAFFGYEAVRYGSANIRLYFPLLLMPLIFPARFITGVHENASRDGKIIIIASAAVIAVYTAALRVSYAAWLFRDSAESSTNIRAGKWINENIPKGASVGIMKYTPHTDATPPFRFADYRIISNFEFLNDINGVRKLPEYFVISETPDFEGLKKKYDWKGFMNRYRLVQYFDDELKIGPFIMRNRFGYGNLPVAVYNLTGESGR
ncbi:MAG: phospholipid carrier-dependent glycosyltransferase [Endomicrobiia bacterium]|nr:phospholipid carrier-dependent glycosyltransferase [Endomicrobiia bacterium]